MTVHAALSYREAVQEALTGGSRFAGLYASEGGAVIRAALVAPDGAVAIESVAARAGVVPTIVDLAPAADWDEREAHDLYGVHFDGHEPLRPLVEHVPLLAHGTVHTHSGALLSPAMG